MVFLQGKSFTAFSGSEVAIALLFPMEKLFESYVLGGIDILHEKFCFVFLRFKRALCFRRGEQSERLGESGGQFPSSYGGGFLSAP